MNKILKSTIIMGSFAVLAFLVTYIFYSRYPETLPSWWIGETSKWPGAFTIPFIMLMVAVVFGLLVFQENRLIGYERALPTYHTIGVVILFAFLLMQSTLIMYWLGLSLDLESIGLILLGISIACVGNYLPRIHRPSLLALLNPWTANNPLLWAKTHRFSGIVWLVCGLLVILVAAFPLVTHLWLVLSLILIMILLPTLYSVFLSKRK